MSLKLNSSGGGSVTLQEPTTASTLTLNLPAVNGTVVTADASGNVGVGTSSPVAGYRLNVVNDAGNAQQLIRAGTNYNSTISFGDQDSSTSGQVLYAHNGDYMRFDTNGSERVRIDSSGNFQFNSGYGSVATAYGCRAWVNFNGTGTVAIRASGNVSSITDNGTGDYTVNFTAAMPDNSYAVSLSASGNGSGGPGVGWAMENMDNRVRSTTQIRIYNLQASQAPQDAIQYSVAVFR